MKYSIFIYLSGDDCFECSGLTYNIGDYEIFLESLKEHKVSFINPSLFSFDIIINSRDLLRKHNLNFNISHIIYVQFSESSNKMKLYIKDELNKLESI
jgi:hypothetical protein